MADLDFHVLSNYPLWRALAMLALGATLALWYRKRH